MDRRRNQNSYAGITLAFVGLILAVVGGSVSDDAVTGTMIYVGAAVVVLLGLLMVLGSGRR